MKYEPTGTVIGYDAVSGEKLFVEKTRATRFPDGTTSLPHKGLCYGVNDRTYVVVGVHEDSTEMLWKIDVCEELPQSDHAGT